MTRFSSYVVVVAISIFSACKKHSSTDTPIQPQPLMKFKANGTQYTFLGVQVNGWYPDCPNIYRQTRNFNGNVTTNFILSGSNNILTPGQGVFLSLKLCDNCSDILIGSYPAAGAPKYLEFYLNSTLNGSMRNPSDPYTVTITSIADTLASGTFTATATGTGGVRYDITDGEFLNLPIRRL